MNDCVNKRMLTQPLHNYFVCAPGVGRGRWWRQGADQPFERNYTRFRPIDGNVLPSDMSKRERMKLFATAESFYSYDAGTWRNVEAALAGAKSVVLPVEGVSKEEWLRSIYGAEELEYGVAYGGFGSLALCWHICTLQLGLARKHSAGIYARCSCNILLQVATTSIIQ